MRFLLPATLIPLIVLFSACAARKAEPSAEAIIEKAIAVHGGRVLDRAVVEFDFRDMHFKITRDGSRFEYVRTYTDSTGHVREVLTNSDIGAITREIDGQSVALTDSVRSKIATPLNSVPYFALLPYNLGDPAVQPRYLGLDTLKGESYHEIEVTFRQDDGGRDYEDRFIYWIHPERHTMDYLAYGFHVDDGGARFREAFNVRTVGGVRFADYYNYTSDSLNTPESPIEHFDDLMEAGNIELLSEIELKNITVRPLDS